MIIPLCVLPIACLEADRVFSAGVATGCGVLRARGTALGVVAKVRCLGIPFKL